MTSTNESSVLFALDELREHEKSRVRAKAAQAREQAAIARRQAEQAARRRQEAKNNAEELVELRQRLATDQAQRLALEARVRQLRAEARQRPVPAPVPQAEPTVLPGSGRPHHLLWATGLLVSCLGVFMATYSPRETGASSAPEPAYVASVPAACPEPGISAGAASANAAAAHEPTPAAPMGPAATASRHKPSTTRPRPPSSRPPRPREPAPIVVEDCDGPLCGLPE